MAAGYDGISKRILSWERLNSTLIATLCLSSAPFCGVYSMVYHGIKNTILIGKMIRAQRIAALAWVMPQSIEKSACDGL